MLGQLLVFILLDYFNSSMFNGFSNKHLKNRFNFVFVIEEIRILIPDLSLLWITSSVWNQNSLRWSVNIIVWFDFHFVNHVVMVAQFFPSVSTLHLLHLHILLVFLHLLLSKLIFLSSSSIFCFSTSAGSGYMLTGITKAAKVLPLTTLLSYIKFYGATLTYSLYGSRYLF